MQGTLAGGGCHICLIAPEANEDKGIGGTVRKFTSTGKTTDRKRPIVRKILRSNSYQLLATTASIV